MSTDTDKMKQELAEAQATIGAMATKMASLEQMVNKLTVTTKTHALAGTLLLEEGWTDYTSWAEFVKTDGGVALRNAIERDLAKAKVPDAVINSFVEQYNFVVVPPVKAGAITDVTLTTWKAFRDTMFLSKERALNPPDKDAVSKRYLESLRRQLGGTGLPADLRQATARARGAPPHGGEQQ